MQGASHRSGTVCTLSLLIPIFRFFKNDERIKQSERDQRLEQAGIYKDRSNKYRILDDNRAIVFALDITIYRKHYKSHPRTNERVSNSQADAVMDLSKITWFAKKITSSWVLPT